MGNYTQELLEFYRNEKIRNIPAPENNEEDFSNIPGVKLVLKK